MNKVDYKYIFPILIQAKYFFLFVVPKDNTDKLDFEFNYKMVYFAHFTYPCNNIGAVFGGSIKFFTLSNTSKVPEKGC